MFQDVYEWFSPALGRDMTLRVYGHAGARVLVFPTSFAHAREWEDFKMVDALAHHLEQGWVQLYCVEQNNEDSWYAKRRPVEERVHNHLCFERYLLDEVLPLSKNLNDNPYLIAAGCSFGALHSVLFGFRHPELVDRIVAMSGYYDAARFLGYENGAAGYYINPIAFVGGIRDDEQRNMLRHQDIILAIGHDDPSFANNAALSDALSHQGIWHAFRVWDGWAHDWPYWREMVLRYIGGPESR